MDNIDSLYGFSNDSESICYSSFIDRYSDILLFFIDNKDYLLKNLSSFSEIVYHFSTMHDHLFGNLDFSEEDVFLYIRHQYRKLRIYPNDELSICDRLFMVSVLCSQIVVNNQLGEFVAPVIYEIFSNCYKVYQSFSKESIKGKTM